MITVSTPARLRRSVRSGIACAAFVLGACSLRAGKQPPGALESLPIEPTPYAVGEVHVEDLSRIPQKLDRLAAAAGDRFTISPPCRDHLLTEFETRYFAPWTATAPLFDTAEVKEFMRHEGRATWYGINTRMVPQKQLQALVDNCDLDSFPSRNDTAISVAPSHLRGLPSYLPLYESPQSYPFDMLSYPHVKLNEPLRVLHATKDGVWLFVETGYTNGWLAARDVALVDRPFIDSWMKAPRLVVVKDYAAIPDGRGTGVYRAKVGTMLPLARQGEGGWEVTVASAGEGGRAVTSVSRIPGKTAVPFPLSFEPKHIELVGDQLLGQPYGWGEIFDLRDCSALLRDFFLPFGIWLPRTSLDQIASLPLPAELAHLAPRDKERLIKERGLPFLTLLYKPGHIMLYVGEDAKGRPLVFHDAWSIQLRHAKAEKIIGEVAITSLEPGQELGLAPGGSLLERVTEMGIITDRCPVPENKGH